MAIRSAQASGLWFLLALLFFLFVIFNHSNSVLPSTYKLSSMHNGGKHHKPRTIQQRLNFSETAWEDSVQRRHEMRASHPTPHNVPFFPAQTLPAFGEYPYTVWDFFPAVWSCPWDIQRVGRLGDGGKWVCGMSKYEERTDAPTIIYSFGVNGESTFEEEILDRTNAQLFAFDYSVNDVSLLSLSHLGLRSTPYRNSTDRQYSPVWPSTRSVSPQPCALHEGRTRRRGRLREEASLLHSQVPHGGEWSRLHVRPTSPLTPRSLR